MKKVKISIIAAISENRALGKNNKLLWHIPEDMKRFRKLTEGQVVIMGRKTYESLGKPLPKRINIVITRHRNKFILSHPELVSGSEIRFRNKFGMTKGFVCSSLEEVFKLAKRLTTNDKLLTAKKEIFIIGGGQIYQQAIKYADKLYLTIVKGNFEADTFFPDYSEFKKIVFKKESGDENYRYTFLELER